MARPAVTVLQLDTSFPRVPGDVASPKTYLDEVEILRIPSATVSRIVHQRPDQIDIAPFEQAIYKASGDIIATSCGFLSYWQDHLQSKVSQPVVTSALCALNHLDPGCTLTLTFDSASLSSMHFPGAVPDCIGLAPDSHLRRTIAKDLPGLDVSRAGAELAAMLRSALAPRHRAVLLECTNLSPYKPALRSVTDLPVHDILSEIEKLRAGTIAPKFL